jgi:branched-chain amino acid transport system ATP-binding protein
MEALAVRGLSKSFGGLRVTKNVDLLVQPGERRLIIGPNGAGKTTLFNLIAGEISPDAGSIETFGADLTHLPARARAHMGVARTYQIITLFARDTLVRNLVFSIMGLRKIRWNPFVNLARDEELTQLALRSLDQVGLKHLAYRNLQETSYGERRRVEIAMALSQNPRVLLLDEPFAGLSVDERRDVHRLLMSIPKDIAIVMIEHDMDVGLEFAEQVTLMHFGEVVVEGSRSDVVNHPRTREVYLVD